MNRTAQCKVGPDEVFPINGVSLVNNQFRQGMDTVKSNGDGKHSGLEYLFIDMLHEIVVSLKEECSKTSRYGLTAAFGSGLNTKKASVWLGFGKMLVSALEKEPKPEEDAQEVLKKEVKELVDGINNNLNTTGIVAALIVTVVVPLFITKMTYVNSSNEKYLSENCTFTTESNHDQPIDSERSSCTVWWGDGYASVLDTVVISMMCIAFVSSILSVSLTVAISTAINMKMVGIEDKIIFIKKHSSLLVLPNVLMVLSMNLIYFALPLTLAYVHGQLKFIISAVIFFIALCGFLCQLIGMEVWCKQHIRSRCIDSITDFLNAIDRRLAKFDKAGTPYVLGKHTKKYLCEKSEEDSRAAIKEIGKRIDSLRSVQVRVDSDGVHRGSGGSSNCGVGSNGDGGKLKSAEG
jgi:hypothetical protein